jgi:ABC-type branched-subunit amino acid transport system permease subunit
MTSLTFAMAVSVKVTGLTSTLGVVVVGAAVVVAIPRLLKSLKHYNKV